LQSARRVALFTLLRDVTTLTGNLSHGYLRLEGALGFALPEPLLEKTHSSLRKHVADGHPLSSETIDGHREAIQSALKSYCENMRRAALCFDQCAKNVEHIMLQTAPVAGILDGQEVAPFLVLRSNLGEVGLCARSLSSAIECILAQDPMGDPLTFNHFDIFAQLAEFARAVGAEEIKSPWLVRQADGLVKNHRNLVTKVGKMVGVDEVYTEKITTISNDEWKNIKEIAEIPAKAKLVADVQKQDTLIKSLQRATFVAHAQTWTAECDGWRTSAARE
jgi:hypothetical protein